MLGVVDLLANLKGKGGVIDIAAQLDDAWLIALSNFLYAITYMRTTLASGDWSKAETLAQASLAAGQTLNNPTILALALNALGHISLWQEDCAPAKGLYQAGLEAAERIDFRWQAGNIHKYLGQVAVNLDGPAEAEKHYVQSLRIAVNLGLNER
jgi:hypothetical protein